MTISRINLNIHLLLITLYLNLSDRISMFNLEEKHNNELVPFKTDMQISLTIRNE